MQLQLDDDFVQLCRSTAEARDKWRKKLQMMDSSKVLWRDYLNVMDNHRKATLDCQELAHALFKKLMKAK